MNFTDFKDILLIITTAVGILLFITLLKTRKEKPPTAPSPPPTAPSPSPQPKVDPDLYARIIEEQKKTISLAEEQYTKLLGEIKTLQEESKELRQESYEFNSLCESLHERYQALKVEKTQLDSEISLKSENLAQLVATVQNILDEQKRQALEDSFYKLHISVSTQQKISDIALFAAKYPEIKNAITAVVYSHFYATEVSSLCNRVLGLGRKVTGIYKITNSLNGMVYVGKSVDIRNRWTQHIKRAVGAEKETQNLLYPAMREHGVWNFSFEVLEECDKDALPQREKFYQDVYKAKEDYSIK